MKLAVPAAVGVPERVPELLRLSPAGRSPEVTANVNDPGGPDALSV